MGELAARHGDCIGCHNGGGGGGGGGGDGGESFQVLDIVGRGTARGAAVGVLGALLIGAAVVAAAPAVLTIGAAVAIGAGVLGAASFLMGAIGMGMQWDLTRAKREAEEGAAAKANQALAKANASSGSSGKIGSGCSTIVTHSPNVSIEGKWAARVTDVNDHRPSSPTISTGAAKVLVNGQPLARKGEKSTCGGIVISTASRTYIGGPSSQSGQAGAATNAQAEMGIWEGMWNTIKGVADGKNWKGFWSGDAQSTINLLNGGSAVTGVLSGAGAIKTVGTQTLVRAGAAQATMTTGRVYATGTAVTGAAFGAGMYGGHYGGELAGAGAEYFGASAENVELAKGLGGFGAGFGVGGAAMAAAPRAMRGSVNRTNVKHHEAAAARLDTLAERKPEVADRARTQAARERAKAEHYRETGKRPTSREIDQRVLSQRSSSSGSAKEAPPPGCSSCGKSASQKGGQRRVGDEADRVWSHPDAETGGQRSAHNPNARVYEWKGKTVTLWTKDANGKLVPRPPAERLQIMREGKLKVVNLMGKGNLDPALANIKRIDGVTDVMMHGEQRGMFAHRRPGKAGVGPDGTQEFNSMNVNELAAKLKRMGVSGDVRLISCDTGNGTTTIPHEMAGKFAQAWAKVDGGKVIAPANKIILKENGDLMGPGRQLPNGMFEEIPLDWNKYEMGRGSNGMPQVKRSHYGTTDASPEGVTPGPQRTVSHGGDDSPFPTLFSLDEIPMGTGAPHEIAPAPVRPAAAARAETNWATVDPKKPLSEIQAGDPFRRDVDLGGERYSVIGRRGDGQEFTLENAILVKTDALERPGGPGVQDFVQVDKRGRDILKAAREIEAEGVYSASFHRITTDAHGNLTSAHGDNKHTWLSKRARQDQKAGGGQKMVGMKAGDDGPGCSGCAGGPASASGQTKAAGQALSPSMPSGAAARPKPTQAEIMAAMAEQFGVAPPKPTFIEGASGRPRDLPKLGSSLNETRMHPMFRGEDKPGNAMWNNEGVKYLRTDAERAPYALTVKDGLLYGADGKPFNTVTGPHHDRAIFVMDPADGKLYASNDHSIGQFHHSSFLAGEPVASAGELVVKDGRLMAMTDNSGHYKPTDAMFNQAVAQMHAQGVDVSNVLVAHHPYQLPRGKW